MRRLLAALLIVLAGCTSSTVDLDVSTSVLDLPTTTTTSVVAATTTTEPPATTTTEQGLEPIVPDVASVIPLRPVLLSNDGGGDRARLDPEQMLAWVNEANRVFAPSRIGFSYDPNEAPDEVSSTLVNEMSGPGSAGWTDRVVRANEIAAAFPGELVVFVSGAGSDDEVGSLHLDFVMIREGATDLCGESDTGLLAHRIGLYLGLPHTYSAVNDSTAEAADALSDALQDVAVFDGDGFGDTLPDPGIHPEHACSGEETVRVGGIEFELPRTNIMSHYPERSQLTLEQADRARWALELRRARQMASPSNIVGADVHEAQDALSGTSGPCGLASVERIDRSIGFHWIGGDHLDVPSEEGCVLEFEIPVPEPGTYDVVALATRAPDHGAVEFMVDGERFALEDLYAPVLVTTGATVVGQTTLDAGSVVIGVDVVGTNARSLGSSAGIDGFALVPVG